MTKTKKILDASTKDEATFTPVVYTVGQIIDYQGHQMEVVEVQETQVQLKAVEAPFFSFPVDIPAWFQQRLSVIVSTPVAHELLLLS